MAKSTVEDWSKELLKLQRTMLDKWVEVTPMAAGMKVLNVKGSVEESIKLGENLIAASLELQSQANESTLEIQKMFWDNYFKTLRQATQYVEKQVEEKVA